MKHLTVRVAWHDANWNGTVCRDPASNTYCLLLDRIRAERLDSEIALSGRAWSELGPSQLPPCKAESAGFMNPSEWNRLVEHPYSTINSAKSTHGNLKSTNIAVPPFSTFAVPFAWMLRRSQESIDQSQPDPLPFDEDPPFATPWIFGRARQYAISQSFFGQLEPRDSLVFFYTKEGQPADEDARRLVVGLGHIEKVWPVQSYAVDAGESYPLWDRLIGHSIRPDGVSGFLLPYSEYLNPTGDEAEDARRAALLREITVVPEFEHIRDFSYAAELTLPDTALSIVVKCLHAVRKVREHGIAAGPWAKREEWLGDQISKLWRERGAFPGIGACLEALGMRLGTALCLELVSSGKLQSDDDPWPLIGDLLNRTELAPRRCYEADLAAVESTWRGLSAERRALLRLLSRFNLTTSQAKRWFDQIRRRRDLQATIEDSSIIENPYLIAELDVGDDNDTIPIAVIDRGMMPDDTIAHRHPVEVPSLVASPIDARRVRAALVQVLRHAADEGDCLLSASEALDRLARLDLARPCAVGYDWLEGNRTVLDAAIETLSLPGSDEAENMACLQLVELRSREERLRSILLARAAREIPSTQENWRELLIEAITTAGGTVDPQDERSASALEEQSAALERVTTRRLSVLVGRAGTGKTSIIGALLRSRQLVNDGILLLAPTGKARVRLGKATGSGAMTVAQFLYRLKRYDARRQRPRFAGDDQYRKEKTVVIDESSMVTMDELVAVLNALDLAHVQRIILVGDPNQLPPIGVGRPFADFVAHLDAAANSDDPSVSNLSQALGRLTIELRTTAGGPSDTLRLASWYTREQQPVDADFILSDLEHSSSFNDLSVAYWTTTDELHEAILAQLQEHLQLAGPGDIVAFNRAMGLSDSGNVDYNSPDGCENFQLLSPVRMKTHGVYDLNRWIQRSFRADALRRSQSPGGLHLGDEEIVVGDKVIQTRNATRRAFNWSTRTTEDVYVANGDLGFVGPGARGSGFLNVVFAGRPGLTLGYRGADFSGDSDPLELAYALTVHKAQGSEFRTVFAIVPKNCRPMSSELLYTALTRSRDRLVLLIEGSDASPLFELTNLSRSETARRNTNLFGPAVRAQADSPPHAENLIHRTDKGHLVRSKSELVIANILYDMGIPYDYERPLQGDKIPGTLRPDFTFVDAAGDLIVWEHLGMLRFDQYRRGWERKRHWYEENGFREGITLFTSEDGDGLNSGDLRALAASIRSRL